ncbi:outer membrane protein assembly factor BamC [Rhizobacter sp. J219]|jgi:outer membrane protein assembly factor BamC|uniref:outer membrane protein assembly factor BamC n=1 Tax=Rhizobacter sp. J219 TaxID=2898430 RepID=UPI002151B3FD|nr:outer membrane protein assembly factor BamC [Rhizobacter sp. J219]MCR5881519.1 outer membrane protein assembly factor BamC [Rhizobacter sp. J219]
MFNVIRVPLSSLATATALLCTLTACSSLDNLASGDKIDYRTAKTKATPLEVPPDLTQLAVDPRYAPTAGVISAAQLQAPGVAASAPVTNQVAPTALGDVRLERQGNLRFLSTNIPTDQLWPLLQEFWKERGLALTVDQPDVGVMETVWSENRAKLSDDFIRRSIGKVFDSLYDTGERDKYRTRVERSERGTDIYISHRGMEEVYASQLKDQTTWKPRPSDPTLEGEMLSRLLIKLGAKGEAAKAAVAQAAATTSATGANARARALAGRPAATLQLDESFDRAWRRVGLALDRSGFTVEDRDRAQGLYFVRYVDPAQAGKEEPGFFAKLFTDAKLSGPTRYRVNVKAEGDVSTVSVYDAKGQPENGDAGQRIVKLLVDDLK